MTEIPHSHEDDARFILFKVGGGLYGTPLLGIREVAESQEPRPIPNTVPFFSGVINMRGQVLGVIDVRKLFGHEATKHPRMALMVLTTELGPLGALVDQIESVARIPSSSIDSKTVIRSHIPNDYRIGFAHHDGRLISLIDLNGILGTEELRSGCTIHE